MSVHTHSNTFTPGSKCAAVVHFHAVVLLATELQHTYQMELSQYPLNVRLFVATCPEYFNISLEYFYLGVSVHS